MSVGLKISTAQDCGNKQFFFFEETGIYNFLSNPTGWATALNAVSVSNITIGLGSHTFVTQTGLTMTAGDTISINFDNANYMVGTITSYNPTTGALVFLCTIVEGAGAYAFWLILYQGYAVNPQTSDAQTAYLTITTPTGDIYNIDLYSTFPTNNTLYGYPISGTSIGLSANTSIPDGVYTFKYTVTGVLPDTNLGGAPFIYTTSIQQLFDCNAQCCINEKMTTLNAGCGCNKNNNAVELYTLLESARAAAKCGKAEKAQAIIDYLTTICGTDCGC
jgi:hypothetical protein